MIKVKHIVRLLAACLVLFALWKAFEFTSINKPVVNNEINIKWGVPHEEKNEPSEKPKRAGLTVRKGKFLLDGKDLIIRAGSVSYFRIMPDYWLYTLTTLRASGLNTVEACVPWNVHENIRGKFNWRTMNDLRHFISIAKDLSLLVILRIGPYVNCDVDFGGIPAWLLGDESIRVRSASDAFLRAYDAYVSQLAYRIEDFQYVNGGNVIALEVETDVTAFIENKRSAEQYVSELIKILRRNNLLESIFTSDSNANVHQYSGVSFALARDGDTVEYNEGEAAWNLADRNARTISSVYRDAPTFVTLYTGMRTCWNDTRRHGMTDAAFGTAFRKALANNASFVINVFAGSTNFNFMASGGVRPRRAIVSSYDMDGLLSEYGTMRARYDMVHDELVSNMKLLSKEQTDALMPDVTAYRHHVKLYDTQTCTGMITYERMVEMMVPEPISMHELGVPAEQLRIEARGGDGATQGWIVYRTRISSRAVKDGRLIFKLNGKMNDRLTVLVNYKFFTAANAYWVFEDERVDVNIDLTKASAFVKNEDVIVDLLVENMGRSSKADVGSMRWLSHARKGFQRGSAATLNDAPVRDWLVYPLEFRPEFFHMLDRLGTNEWTPHPRTSEFHFSPALYKYMLRIERNVEPCDTFIELGSYVHGLAFVNALGLGRYDIYGPQRTLFVPGAVMRHDYWNKFYLVELYASPGRIRLVDRANFLA